MRNLYLEYMNSKEKLHNIYGINMSNAFLDAKMVNEGTTLLYLLPEISEQSSLVEEMDYFNTLEVKINDENKRFLSMFGEMALKNNPIGLTMDYLREESIDPKYIESTNYIYNNMKDAFASNNVSCVNSFTKCLANPDAETDKAMTAMLGTKQNMMNQIFSVETDHKVSREDVKEAKEYLETCGEKIKDLKDKAKDKANDFKMKVHSLKGDMDRAVKDIHGREVVHGNGNADKKEVEKEGCNNLLISQCIAAAAYLETQDMIDRSYIVQLENQILEMNNQARKIIAATACHNPRNIVGSAPITEMVMNTVELRTNDIYESCMNIDAKQYVDEAAVQNAFDKLKAKVTMSNKRFLKKYEDAALKSNCKDIVIDKWYTPVDIDSKLKSVMKEVDSTFVSKSDDPDELKQAYKDMRGSIWLSFADGKMSSVSAKMLDGNSMVWVKNIALKKTLKHRLTQSDVKEAIKFLKESDRRIDEEKSKYNKQLAAYSYANDGIRTLGRTKDEKYIKKIDAIRRTVVDNVLLNYQKMKLMQLKVLQQQSRIVVLKAARVSKISEAEIEEMQDIDNILEQAFALIDITTKK